MKFSGRLSGLAPALLLLAAPLFGCGFEPIYGSHVNNANVTAELNDVAIGNIPDRHGQILRNDLIDRMYGHGRPRSAKYKLEVNLRATEEGLGLLPNSITTLTELNLYADYTLSASGGEELMKGTAHTLANYDQPSAQYSTLAARENAYQRCLNEVGEQIVNRVSLYFSEHTPEDDIRKKAREAEEKARAEAGEEEDKAAKPYVVPELQGPREFRP